MCLYDKKSTMKRNLKEWIEACRQGDIVSDDPDLLSDERVTRELMRQWDRVPETRDESLDPIKRIVWNRISGQLSLQKAQVRMRLYRRLCVAASLFIVLLGGYAFLQKPEESVRCEFSTGNQDKREVLLSDGTRVILGPNSRFGYPERFGSDERRVVLDGQAFFQVAPNFSAPFSVDVDGVQVTALGTSFEIFVPTDRHCVETILRTGKVRIDHPSADGSATESHVLLPGRRLTFDRTTRNTTVEPIDAVRYTEWISDTGQSFKNERLQFILPRLERWYGVEIRPDEGVLGRGDRFTFKITDESLDHILNLIQSSSGIKWQKDASGCLYWLY